MTVTVLVPVYGVEKYIEGCTESLFSQTYKDIEYVFCDDCSPDKSIDVLQKVMERHPERASHIRIIQNERNKGLGGTRRHLLSEIRTEYFMIVDSDDFLPVDAVEKLARRMQETNVDIVDGAYQTWTNGNITSTVRPCHDRLDKYRRKVQVGNLARHQVWGRLYKTEVVQRVPDLFVEGIDMAEDYCATTRLAAVTTRAWTDEVVYLHGAEICAADVCDADALIVRTRTRCDRRLLEHSKVKFVATATIGYDHIDTNYMRENGIFWTNCPGCNAASVAQYLECSLLLLQQKKDLDLSEATIGIVGCGHVGSKVKAVSERLGMRVLVSDPPLEQALSLHSPLISLHPLRSDERH